MRKRARIKVGNPLKQVAKIIQNRADKVLAFLLILFLAACQGEVGTASKLTPLTLQLAWTHSAQFAGFYAAVQNGYYTEEGLIVTFIEGGPEVERLRPVLEGKAHFGITGSAELITARAAGEPVRAVAAVLRRDPFAFFALSNSDITRPEDFAGKTIQIRPRSAPILRALTGRVGLAPAQYVEDYEAEFGDLYSGKVDVAVGFTTAQLLEAEQAGYHLNVIHPDDYGIHFYSDVIFTTDDFVVNQPELALRFLRASFKGWTYVVENPNETGQLVAKYNPAADPALENNKMIASLPLINTGEDHIGWMKPEVWKGMVETLQSQGVITSAIDISQLYTLQYLQEIYPQK